MKISILLITHDRPDCLARTLAGLVSQSRRPDEVIVIDNGSSIGCEMVITQFVGSLPLCYERTEPRTIASARNYAVDKSTGDILLFTDDDCVPEPEWVAQMIVAFENHATIGEVGGKIISFQREINAVTRIGDSMYRYLAQHYEHGLDRLDTELPYRAFFPTANAAIRREAFTAVGGFDPVLFFGEDIDISFRIMKAGWALQYQPSAIVRHKHRETFKEVVCQFWQYGKVHPYLFRKFHQTPGTLTLRARKLFQASTNDAFFTLRIPFLVRGCVYLNGFLGECFMHGLLVVGVVILITFNVFAGGIIAIAGAGIFIWRINKHHVRVLKLPYLNIGYFFMDIITRAAISLSGFFHGIKDGILFIN